MHYEQIIPRPLEEVFAFFNRPENLSKITPPWMHFKILTPPPIEMKVGAIIDYRIRLKGLPLKWQTEITAYNPPHSFIDLQKKGPYRYWQHTHRFQSIDSGTLVTDDFEYTLPLGWLGQIAHRLYVKRDLEKIFGYRKEVIKEIFGDF